MTLREWLKKKKITQQRFGEMLNPPVSSPVMSYWINGIYRIPLERAVEIERITKGKVRPADLIHKENEPEQKESEAA